MKARLSFHAAHPIKTILVSPQAGMLWLRRFLLGMLLLLGLAGLRLAIGSLLPPNVYHKDFMQEYLMAQAVIAGMDPYLPLPELASFFLGSLPQINLPHPTPHPPPVVLVGLIFSFLAYETVAIVWFVLELVFIGGSIGLLLSIFGRKPGLPLVGLLTVLSLVFRPFIANLAFGQLNTLMLILLAASWKNLREGKDWVGGTFIGFAVALKLFAWPLVLYLALRGRWKAVWWAGSAFIGANLASGFFIGFDRLFNYYINVSAVVSPLYRAHEGNFSLWTVGYRFFDGIGSSGLSGILAPPLVDLPLLAAPVSAVLVIAFLLLSILVALRCRSFDAAFSIVLCSSLLISPIFWFYYLVLALIPVAFVIDHLISLGFPQLETWLAALLLVFLLLPREILVSLIWALPHEADAGAVPVFSSAASLISLLPAIVVLALSGLVFRLDRSLKPACFV